MSYYKIKITETGSTRPQDDDFSTFNFEEIVCENKSEIATKLKEHCGIKKINKENKIYCDIGSNAIEVGFVRSFWNKDLSHNGKSWWQRDWIEVKEIDEKPCLDF
jgi:hypothetical protein